jgi:hypothetical protein
MFLWWDSRHHSYWGFRASERQDDIEVCLNPRDLSEFVKVVDRLPGLERVSYKTVPLRHPERAMLRLDLTLEKALEGLCRNNRWDPFSVITVLGRGCAYTHPGAIAGQPHFNFHALLGFGRYTKNCSSTGLKTIAREKSF